MIKQIGLPLRGHPIFVNHSYNYTDLTITITILSNLIGASTALFFTNYCVVLKLDSEIGQLTIIRYPKSDSDISQSY